MDAKMDMDNILDFNAADSAMMAEDLLSQIEMNQEPLVVQVEDASDELSALVEMEAEPVVEVLSEEGDSGLGLDRAAFYEEQGAGKFSVENPEDVQTVEHTQEELLAVEEPKKKRRGKKSKEAESATSPAPSSADSSEGAPITKSSLLKKKADISGLLGLGYKQDEVDAILASIDSAPKKVADKANNLVRYALGREHISNFTRFAMIKLRDNPEGFTVPELVEMLQEERRYSLGTARSQAQQQSRLFTLFGMASKDGSKITLMADNPLAKAVVARLTGDVHVKSDNDSDEVEAVAA